MRRRVKQIDRAAARGVALDTGLAAVALFVLGWLRLHPGADWRVEAQPAANALLAGHLHSFLALAPIYGASLVLRAPFLLATKLSHSGDFAVYRAGAIPCLMATGALGVWLSGQMRAKGSSTIARVLVLLVCVANPLIMWALKWGHPEDLLSAALCVAAVLCALRDRTIVAAVLLGLAIANKEWAVLAAGPMLVALPRARIRALVVAGGVAAVLMAPFMLATAGFTGQFRAVGTSTGAIFHPWQIWWFLGSVPHARPGLFILDPNFVYRLPPSWLGGLGHSLVVVLMPVLTALFALVRRPWAARARHDALLLLALLLALRCMLDPWDISYYWLPFLFALLAWEVVATRRAPAVSLVATAVVAWTLQNHFAFDTQAAVFLVVSVPSLIALAVAVYAPNVGQRALAFSRRVMAPPAPAAASSSS
ncbi:MAG TPA: hypothetical protein VGH67_00215 [Solirubrobacteraceae bacterium]